MTLEHLDWIAATVEVLCSELESELRHRYGEDPHPAMAERMERDMEPVEVGRVALTLMRQMRDNAVEGYVTAERYWPTDSQRKGHRAYTVSTYKDFDDSVPALLITPEDG